MKTAKPIALAIVWIYAVLGMVAVIAAGSSTDMYTLGGLRYATGFAVSWFLAGGNMIPSIGYQNYAEAWSVDTFLKYGDNK